MSRKQAECLLAAVIFARSTSLLCAGVTLLGVGFLTLRSGVGFGPGEGLCLLEACLYAAAIILIGSFPALATLWCWVCSKSVFWVCLPPSPLCCWNRPTCPEQPGNGG